MKNLLKLFLGAATALVALAGCSGGGSSSNMAQAVGSPSFDYRTDWARFGLLGMVKSVEQNGYTMNFSAKGKFDDNDEPRTRFKGRVRTDTGYSGFAQYVFDDLGRLVEQSAEGYKATFVYEEDHFYPISKKEEIEDEFGDGTEIIEHAYTYKAKDFDEEGNWLARMDNGEKEVRVISYYEDPYAVKPQPYYKTPEEVAEAMLKAEKKGDAVAYYATLSYKDRKRYEIPLERYVGKFQAAQENDKHRLVSYKITEIEMKSENMADLHVDKTYADGSVYEYEEMLTKGDDGYWYNGGLSSGELKK